MDADSLLGVIRRRWVLVTIAIVISLGAGLVVVLRTQPIYQVQGSVVLIPPPLTAEQATSTGKFSSQNPLLEIDNTMTTNARLIVSALTSPPRSDALRRDGAVGDFSVQIAADQVSPLVIVKASDTDRGQAVATAKTVMRAVRSYLAEEQADLGVPTSALITTRVLAAPTSATRSSSKRLEYGVVAAVAVFLVLGLLILLYDLWRRPRPRNAEVVPGVGATPAVAAPDKPSQRAAVGRVASQVGVVAPGARPAPEPGAAR